MNAIVARSTGCTLNPPQFTAEKVKQAQIDLLCRMKQTLRLCFFKKGKGKCKEPSFTHPQEQEYLRHAVNLSLENSTYFVVFSAMTLQYKMLPSSRKTNEQTKRPQPVKV